MRQRRLVCLLAALSMLAFGLAAAPAHASETATAANATSVGVSAIPRHALYVELLGKGGLWGLGYDYQLSPRLAIGAVASYSALHGQRLGSLSPYLSLYPFGSAEEAQKNRHRGFLQAGPQLFVASTPSPGPEWSGRTSAGVGGELSVGYEYRAKVVLRAYAMGTVGQNGFAPWTGFSIGWLK